MKKYIYLACALLFIIGVAIGNPALNECIEKQGADVCHAKHY